MKKVNPSRQFIKKVEHLINTVHELTQSDTQEYWPFGYSHEALETECFKREDGLWELKDKINPHINGGQKVVFIWRKHPEPCYGGRPVYSSEKEKEIYEKSETEKVLFETDKLEFVWTWHYFRHPTEYVWSYIMGPAFFEVRIKETKQIVIRETKKGPFIRCYNDLFPAETK